MEAWGAQAPGDLGLPRGPCALALQDMLLRWAGLQDPEGWRPGAIPIPFHFLGFFLGYFSP